MVIIVDAMGGDNAPGAIVNGSIDAVLQETGFDIVLCGDERKIKKIIKERNYDGKRIRIRHASEVVTNSDKPSKVVKNKKDSSMVVAFDMLKNKEGDMVISCGSTGALLTCGILILKRMKGIDRPAIATLIPSKKGNVLIIDAGLNAECKPINYLQFGILGSYFMNALFNMRYPKVGLVNIGSEEEKGTDDLREAYGMLKESELNFVGNVEGNDVMAGMADVVVCNGFVGNVMLKLLEGTASFFIGELKNIFYKSLTTKLSALFLKDGVKQFKDKLDPDINGGAPILGVDGLVLKSHGNSNAKTIKSVILKGYALGKTGFIDALRTEFDKKK
jgi:glycerol-3-phosphate acyltransferase PlsX